MALTDYTLASSEMLNSRVLYGSLVLFSQCLNVDVHPSHGKTATTHLCMGDAGYAQLSRSPRRIGTDHPKANASVGTEAVEGSTGISLQWLLSTVG